jgi:cephalosporin hydroxylase
MTTATKKQPMTVVVADTLINDAEVWARIKKTHDEHGDVLQRFHEVWYNCGHTWQLQTFLGVGMMKGPNDLWIYHDIICQHRPQTIIETGTYRGGSALWFAFLMDVLNIKDGHVYTIDIEDYRDHEHGIDHPRISYLRGDSTDVAMRDAVRDELPANDRRLIVLDADHSAEHVYQELCLWAPLVRVGDWLVVEDTNIAWEPYDRGARGGLTDYWNEHPGEFLQDLMCEKHMTTMCPGGWLRRIKPHVERP